MPQYLWMDVKIFKWEENMWRQRPLELTSVDELERYVGEKRNYIPEEH